MQSNEQDLAGLSSAARNRVRAALAVRPRGLFTDVDGTISRIAPTPDAATLLPGVAELLGQARGVFDVVAAVSGRAAADTRRMVGLPGLTYLGNHGLERMEPQPGGGERVVVVPTAEPYVAAINATAAALGAELAPRYPGLRVERKGVTASIHVRGAADPLAAEAAVYEAATEVARRSGLRVTRGKMVVELRPPVDVDKGVAIEDAIRAHGLRGALYLGDDRTDVDAFRALRRLTTEGVCQGVAVAVLHDETPPGLAEEADIALSSIEQVPDFLGWLLASAR